jgi:regulator of protease activity HflC (stomatin/prohibitin superfamily)
MTDGPRPSGTPEDFDDLGAGPTRPAGSSSGKTPRGPRAPRAAGRRRFALRVGVILLVVLGLALLAVVPSSVKKTPRNRVGISYGGGPIEAAHFQKVVQPGSPLFFNGVFDQLYLYPSDTQTYIVSKDPNQGDVQQVDSIISPSRDRVQIEYQVAVYFKLNTDRLRSFHEQLGLQYSAYATAGWRRLIQDTFRQQIENVLQEETRKHDVADLYGDAAVLTQIQDEIEGNLGEGLIGALGQPYLCGPTFAPGGDCEPPTFIIKKVDIPQSVSDAFEANRTSQIKVLTAQNEIAQRTAEAEAIKALNQGLSQAGMPYVLLKAIESGKISFWVLPSDSGVTLQAPSLPGGTGDDAASTTTTTTGGG